MRKLITITAAIAALGAIALPSLASANAGTSTGINSSGIGTTQGNTKNQTTQYKSSYNDPVMGPVSCTGVHKDGKNTGFTKGTDTWTCSSTTGSPLLNVSPSQVLDIGWNSDYYAVVGQVPTTNAHITVSLDGMSETGTAAYGAAL